VVDVIADHRLDRYGIEAREPEGLDGIVTAPFLHVGFGHRMEILQEVVHTTDALVIDLQTCIHCDNCVRACETIHDDGVSRLLREGIKIDHYLVATSCRNCEDPLCMIECPVSAIARDEQGEVYIKDHCVGCGACVRNCPYGNINLFDPKIHAKRGPAGQLWNTVLGLLGGGGPDRADEIHKPVKCDLCRDFITPNCVRSCPTGAAMRVNPQVFFKLKP
jgi:Fe-S-cluster-containing dehydrogenase component